jgi:hypothetical protein|tara:strand:- start:109 stop:369 length:261 start_codon:yes stop_codon:yes gene_type:complete
MKTMKNEQSWYLALTFDTDEHDGFEIADRLEEKFRDNYSGSGCGGMGRDIGFFGTEEELLKIERYIKQHHGDALTYNTLEPEVEDW